MLTPTFIRPDLLCCLSGLLKSTLLSMVICLSQYSIEVSFSVVVGAAAANAAAALLFLQLRFG